MLYLATPQIVGLGAMNMDYFYRVKSLLKDGEAEVEEVQAFPGGSAANTIYALAKLGVPCGFVGAVGGDEAGENLIADLKQVGVDTSFISIKSKAKTGSVVAIVDKDGRRALYVHPGANGLMDKDDMLLDYLASAQIVHTSAFVGDKQFFWQRDILTALASEAKLSFAPGALYARRGLDALKPFLKRTLFLFLNRKELKELTGGDLEAGAQLCLQNGCQTVVVTLGKGLRRGKRTCCSLVAKAGNTITWVQAAPGQKKIVDTTGAGDAFTAGFLYGYFIGKSSAECGLLGDLMAGFCISKLGARSGLPTLLELAQSYQQITGQRL